MLLHGLSDHVVRCRHPHHHILVIITTVSLRLTAGGPGFPNGLILVGCAPQQYMQVQEQPAPMWGQGQAGVQKMQMQPAKQSQQQPYFLSPQAPPGPLDNSNKGMKFPDVVQMQDYYWEQAAYRIGGGERGLGKRPPPGGFCPEADAPSAAGPRGAPFEVRHVLCVEPRVGLVTLRPSWC